MGSGPPVKSPGDLSELETIKLRFAQEHLKHCAFIYSANPQDSMSADILYSAAREFDATCREIGFAYHWRQKWVDVTKCCTDSDGM